MEAVVAELRDQGIHALEHLPTPGGPAVILSHGINVDLTEDRSDSTPGLFDRVVEILAGHGIGTIRFDFRGHGQSIPVDGYVSISSEVGDLCKVIDYAERAGCKLSGLVGCSFGACATSVVVADRLANVGSVVLLNPVVRPRETFLDPGSDWARQSFTPRALEALKHGSPLMLDGELPLGHNFIDDVLTVAPTRLLGTYGGRLAIVHGTLDSYVPFEYSQQFACEMNSTFVAVTGSEHGFGKLGDRNFVADFAGSYLAWAAHYQ